MHTILLDHKCCNVSSLRNEIILQQELHNFVPNNVLEQKVKTQQQQQQQQN